MAESYPHTDQFVMSAIFPYLSIVLDETCSPTTTEWYDIGNVSTAIQQAGE
jgi:hypothetical protein